MICALLILQEPELPLPLDTLSPWIDMVTRARTDVFADLEAQTHRRFIKTHTPLDGIPNDPAVTYICLGRDPRDVGLSMGHHIDNTDIGAFLSQRERAAAIDGIELGPLRPPRPRPDGERDRFWQWAGDDATQVAAIVRETGDLGQAAQQLLALPGSGRRPGGQPGGRRCGAHAARDRRRRGPGFAGPQAGAAGRAAGPGYPAGGPLPAAPGDQEPAAGHRHAHHPGRARPGARGRQGRPAGP